MSTKLGTIKAVIDWLPIDALGSDLRIQRTLIGARVKHLAENFDPGGLGVITVSLRSDGGYFLIDGQHRIEAARRSGHGHMKVKCHVYKGLTLAEEAQLFLTLNDARSVSAIDKYKIGLVANDPTAIGVDEILTKHGLRVGKAKTDGNVGCVDLLLKLYKRDPDLLDETLNLSLNSWGVRYGATERLVMDGLAKVVGRYDGELDPSVLVGKLKKYHGGPGALIGDARALSDIKHVAKARALAEIVVDAYNKNRRSGSLSPL